MKPATLLLRWYRRHGRDLPWRHTQNPYRILVSEIMLQQTQVDRVKTFYRSWVAQFPNWKRLANASNADVLKAWSGLGYNRRALMLRDIARTIEQHGVPSTIEDWEKIKGIGPYTARAISAFAQRKRTLPIDTNIRRVLGRLLFGIPYPEPAEDKKIEQASDDFLPKQGNYFDVPQAMFDLATMICTKTPACARCPLRRECKAAPLFLSGRVTTPKAMVKKPYESKHRNKPFPDRIYRGRILKLLSDRPAVRLSAIGQRIDHSFDISLDEQWLQGMIDRLIADGMITSLGKRYTLSKD